MPNIYVTKKVYERLEALKARGNGTFSGAVGSILDQFVDRQFDLNATKDTGFVGVIGEAIAWHYLVNKGFLTLKLGAGGPPGDITDTFSLLENRLTQEQLQFLGDARERLSWDFVGKKENQACLIEVKPSRTGKRPRGLRTDRRRGMTADHLREASRRGFMLFLVNVELVEDWQAIVTVKEIPVD